jgi:hypothetical protein
MLPMRRFVRLCALPLFCACVAAPIVSARQTSGDAVDPIHKPLDEVLDLYVRDGYVYYRALRSDRGRLDRYIGSLNVPAETYARWSREQKMAFWVNAYNVFVLKTVIDAYPIRGKSPMYPPISIRQIPGAFERVRHRAAGRTVTLDEIEKTILPEFKEPRLALAIGRGAVGSGRLRSEAYSANRIAQQLDGLQREFVTHRTMVKIDRAAGEITVTPIVSWHEADFVAAYDKGATGLLAQRSPIERAIVGFLYGQLLPLERDFVQKNEFRVTYHAFDWRLNDLTGGRIQ